MPIRCSFSPVTGPTPGITPTGIGPSSATSVPGSTIRRPSGLASSVATLAMNFDVATPDRGGQPAGGRRDLSP